MSMEIAVAVSIAATSNSGSRQPPEAFAAQVLATTDALGLDPMGADSGRVCPDGGALALGHPWGASGAVAVTRLFSTLVVGGHPAGTLGLAAAAIGGGMGIAIVVEVVR